MSLAYKIFKIYFFVFFDISGMLLGLFLLFLGLALILEWQISENIDWLTLTIGIGAFFLHLGHYFDLKYMGWLFGSRYFIQK